jgi:mannose-binding lectin 2
MSFFHFAAIFVVASIVCSLVAGEILEFHTFQPPFQEVDSTGARLPSPHWRTYGTTVVNNNFIRLTPDRQSKKGALWSRRSVNVPNFTAILKFRISGQGKNFFGDGIGMWIVQQSYYTEGNLHGFQEKFVGVGIIFDTFKNTESISTHRDVTVLVNDGTKTYEMMTENVQGCNTNVRYHADRADFSVLDASRAKISIDDNKLEIMMDPKNANEWEACVTIPRLNLPSGWLAKSYVGLTATTGQLADNHDIIYLKTSSDAELLERKEEEAKIHFGLDEDLSSAEKFNRLVDVTNKLIDAHETLDHHVEHQLASVVDHIKNLIGKLEKREDKSETRLTNLEEIIKKEVEGSLETRLSALEMQMKGSVERKMTNIESALDRKMARIETKTTELAQNNAGGWKLPFMILVVIIATAAGGLYYFYRRLLKMHIL